MLSPTTLIEIEAIIALLLSHKMNIVLHLIPKSSIIYLIQFIEYKNYLYYSTFVVDKQI